MRGGPPPARGPDELRLQGVELLAQPLAATEIVQLLRVGELLAQLGEAAAIRVARGRVEKGPASPRWVAVVTSSPSARGGGSGLRSAISSTAWNSRPGWWSR